MLKASLSPLPWLCSTLIPSSSPQAGGKPDSLPIAVIRHPIHVALVCGKRTQFNFPVVYGQIFLLAERAVDFLWGPFAPYTFVFSAPLAWNDSHWKPERLQQGYRASGQLCPTPCGFGTAFVPFSHSLDRETSPWGLRASTAVPGAELLSKEPTWHLSMWHEAG